MSKILIVDDSSTLRESLSFVLEDEGHDIVQAENGAIGLERYKENQDVSLVITDINMPIMNGLEFLANLRRLSREIPVIVLTTENEKEKIELAKQYKANAWIIKPFKQGDLVSVVNKVLV